MSPTSNRRDFLRTLIGGAAGLSLARTATSGTVAAIKLTDNLTQITGAGANIVVLTGPGGLLMVNGGLPEHSADLMNFVSDYFKAQRVQALFNTDWHLENTGSNETLGKAGAKIIAHENTKLWLGTEIFVKWQNRTYKPRPKEALPNETFYTAGKMTFGTEQINYGYLLQAHTDGDIYVHFPATNILVTGDVFTVGTYPILDYTTGGWLGGLVNATKTLLSLANAETRIVPGVGLMQTRTDLQAQHDMLVTMMDRIVKMMKQGMGPDDMMAAAPTKDFDEKWGDPKQFLSNVYPGLWAHVRELGGIV